MIQYQRTVKFSTVIIDVGLDEQSLIVSGLKTTAGAPAATAGVYRPAAIIQNIASGIAYINTGSTASPVWSAMETSSSGFTLPIAETDASTTTGNSFALTFSALTSGFGNLLTGPGASLLAAGAVQQIAMGLSTVGAGSRITVTGVYTGVGVRQVVANAATTGVIDMLSATGLTTGIIQQAIAAQATMTTGRYYSANDGANEVFGIGANGHIHSTASADGPTIAVSTANGISAAAITAGGTDTCGVITTTGTQDGSGDTVLQLTFGKTYTTAPKAIMLFPLNSSASKVSTTTLVSPYISAVTATTFDITIPEDSAAGATPSFAYLVIA